MWSQDRSFVVAGQHLAASRQADQGHRIDHEGRPGNALQKSDGQLGRGICVHETWADKDGVTARHAIEQETRR